jgi:hypothetical protein
LEAIGPVAVIRPEKCLAAKDGESAGLENSRGGVSDRPNILTRMKRRRRQGKQKPNFNEEHDVLGFSTVSIIPAGQNLNIICDQSRLIHFEPKPKITSAVIQILLSYNVDILWAVRWPRVPEPTVFTWAGKASNPQWVRGYFAR